MDRATEAHAKPRRFAAFEQRNFRIYVAGQLLSTVGTWMQTVAQGWLVLELTNRTDTLGAAVALQWLPLLLLGAPAGVLADKVDNRKLLLGTSVAAGTIAFGLGAVVASGHATIWWIYAFALALGLVNAVERPAMQAFVFQLVGPSRLPSGVAINQMINTTARLIGPAIAGVLIATSGLAASFFVNAASYLVVIGALLLLRPDEMEPRPKLARAKGQLRDGFRYVRHTADVRRPLVVMAVVGTVVYNFQTTIPALVRFSFDRGAGSVGAVLSVSAIGSIAGGVVAAGIRPHPVRSLWIALVGLAVTLLTYGIAPNFTFLLVSSVGLGVASTVFITVDTTVLQQASDPSLLGRVMALHQVAFQGSTPIGSFLLGWLIEWTNPRAPFYLAAVTAALCGAVVALGPRRAGGPRGAGPEGAVAAPVAASS